MYTHPVWLQSYDNVIERTQKTWQINVLSQKHEQVPADKDPTRFWVAVVLLCQCGVNPILGGLRKRCVSQKSFAPKNNYVLTLWMKSSFCIKWPDKNVNCFMMQLYILPWNIYMIFSDVSCQIFILCQLVVWRFALCAKRQTSVSAADSSLSWNPNDDWILLRTAEYIKRWSWNSLLCVCTMYMCELRRTWSYYFSVCVVAVLPYQRKLVWRATYTVFVLWKRLVWRGKLSCPINETKSEKVDCLCPINVTSLKR